MSIIKFYSSKAEHGYLSNLYPAPVNFEGKLFKSSEEAYQYGKPVEKAIAEWIISAPHQRNVADAAHSLRPKDIVSDWDKIKVNRMSQVIKAKFEQNLNLKNKLIDTGLTLLVEDSPVDYFWGIGAEGTGKNMLGQLLMDIREYFRKTE